MENRSEKRRRKTLGGADGHDEHWLERLEGATRMNGDVLLDSLASMWARRDPVPVGLVSRVQIALALVDLEVEYELLRLTEHSTGLVGARGPDDSITFTFDAEDLAMVLRVSSTGIDTCRVDGWITPARLMTVTATQSGKSIEAHVVDGGRFEFAELKSGATHFLLHPDSTTTNLVTPAVDL